MGCRQPPSLSVSINLLSVTAYHCGIVVLIIMCLWSSNNWTQSLRIKVYEFCLCLSVCLSVCLCLSVSLSVCLSVCLCLSVSVSLCLSLSLSQSPSLSVRLSVFVQCDKHVRRTKWGNRVKEASLCYMPNDGMLTREQFYQAQPQGIDGLKNASSLGHFNVFPFFADCSGVHGHTHGHRR